MARLILREQFGRLWGGDAMWRVKVCGLTNIADAEFAWEEGADALGFVLEPTSPRTLRDWSIFSYPPLASNMEGVKRIAVFGEYFEGEDVGRFDVVQAIGSDRNVGIPWMPTFRPKQEQPIEEWLTATEGWEWCLLDPYKPGPGGGSGEKIDWQSAGRFVELFRGKVILAGGLNADNVAEAIERVKPYGVDASSGLEASPGIKSESQVVGYILNAWQALKKVHGDDLESSGHKLSM